LHSKRLKRLIEALDPESKRSLIVTKLENIFYLCGFRGTTGILFINGQEATLIVDARYTERAKEEVKATEILQTANVWKGLLDILKRRKIDNCLYEEHAIYVEDFERFKDKSKKEGLDIRLEAAGRPVEKLRLTKDDHELKNIRIASEITSSSFKHIVDFLDQGVKESDIVSELYCFIHGHGVDKAAFDIIVASGERAAMPHAGVSEKKIDKGDFVLIDMGVCYNGYFSDMTRTFIIGNADERQRSMYQTVREAQTRALDGLEPGMSGGTADDLARKVLDEHGYGDMFIHGLGHGVGLEVHESPALAPGGKDELKKDTVFTVEPGLYKPGFGGVRIEDTVVMTGRGPEVLTDFTKELIEL